MSTQRALDVLGRYWVHVNLMISSSYQHVLRTCTQHVLSSYFQYVPPRSAQHVPSTYRINLTRTGMCTTRINNAYQLRILHTVQVLITKNDRCLLCTFNTEQVLINRLRFYACVSTSNSVQIWNLAFETNTRDLS